MAIEPSGLKHHTCDTGLTIGAYQNLIPGYKQKLSYWHSRSLLLTAAVGPNHSRALAKQLNNNVKHLLLLICSRSECHGDLVTNLVLPLDPTL